MTDHNTHSPNGDTLLQNTADITTELKTKTTAPASLPSSDNNDLESEPDLRGYTVIRVIKLLLIMFISALTLGLGFCGLLVTTNNSDGMLDLFKFVFVCIGILIGCACVWAIASSFNNPPNNDY